MTRMFRFLLALPLVSSLVPSAWAATGNNGFGTFQVSGFGFGQKSFAEIVNSLMTTFQVSMFYVATAVFIGGAFFFTISAGDEQRKSTGKDMMIGAVIGAAVVWTARQILLAVLFFIYGSYGTSAGP